MRLSDETLEYINSYSGNGLTKKLESMVYFVSQNEDKIKKRVAELEKTERELLGSINNMKKIENNLKTITRYLDEVKRMTSNVPLDGQIRLIG